MASVEQLKTFEDAVKAESEANMEYLKELAILQKLREKVAKQGTKVDELHSVWCDKESIKSDAFDQLLHTVQNL